MGKKQDKANAAIQAQLLAAITALQNPKSNPAQDYLTNSAVEGAEFMKRGDFSNLPKGQFFDFKTPIEEMKQYDNTMNVGQTGTFALGDSEGAGKAMALAGDYRKNMFARDSGENYQNNIRTAAGNIRGGLEQAAGAQTQNSSAVISALSGLYNTELNKPQKQGFWSSLLPSLVGAGTSLATKFL